jgi:hypothetical protein
MADPKPAPPPPPPPPYRHAGALLSFLVPGLGQIYQGVRARDRNRLTKGIFFLLALYGMFFYGQWLGHWQNVYLPHIQEQLVDEDRPQRLFGKPLSPFVGNLWARLQYAGQFWIGVVAWPALWNYAFPDMPIFGSYQASPGAVKKGEEHLRRESNRDFEQLHINLQVDPNMGKRFDIAWVYTVIAGVLNLLVIYDAWAGPIYRRPRPGTASRASEKGGGP